VSTFFRQPLLHLQKKKDTGLSRLFNVRFRDFIASLVCRIRRSEYYMKAKPYMEILAHKFLCDIGQNGGAKVLVKENDIVCTLAINQKVRSAMKIAKICRYLHQKVEAILTIHRWIPLND
jgi:hypothetical protein